MGRSTTAIRHLGLSRASLANSGDRVLLRSFDGARLDCRAWGRSVAPVGTRFAGFRAAGTVRVRFDQPQVVA